MLKLSVSLQLVSVFELPFGTWSPIPNSQIDGLNSPTAQPILSGKTNMGANVHESRYLPRTNHSALSI